MRAAAFLALAATLFHLPAHAQEADGRSLFARPDKGNCIACHRVPEGAGPATRSDLGPALEGARMRSLGRPALAAVIEDPTRANPATVMPPYGRHHILTPEEIGRVVDYLHALP